jgi:hypothetical protein
MNLVTDLLPPTTELADTNAMIVLSALRRALETGDRSGLSQDQLSFAERIEQANAKIASGSGIARISELMTLAQFGAGSVGAAVAYAFDDPGAGPAMQSLFTSQFLTRVVMSAQEFPHLIPGDLLKTQNMGRDSLTWPVSEPIYRNILERAKQAAASPGRTSLSSPALKKLFDRRQAETVRQIRKLAGKNPDSARARLNALDRFIISLTIRLHIRGTP